MKKATQARRLRSWGLALRFLTKRFLLPRRGTCLTLGGYPMPSKSLQPALDALVRRACWCRLVAPFGGPDRVFLVLALPGAATLTAISLMRPTCHREHAARIPKSACRNPAAGFL